MWWVFAGVTIVTAFLAFGFGELRAIRRNIALYKSGANLYDQLADVYRIYNEVLHITSDFGPTEALNYMAAEMDRHFRDFPNE